MIAYSEKSLDQLLINEEARPAMEKQLISKEEYAAVASAHPVKLYRPNLFIRIGLFLVTVVVVLMAFGLFMLIASSAMSSETGLAIVTGIFAVLIYLALEGVISGKKHYRSGVDDALLWLAFGFIIADVNIFTRITELQQAILIFILSLYASIRFANSVMSGVMFLSFLAIIFYSLAPAGPLAKVILPFVVMAVSVIIYFTVKKYRDKPTLVHYRYSLLMIEVLSLVTTYAAVNYFAVRELSNELFNLRLAEGASMPGGWFFWVTTILLPPLYIFRALQTKDAPLLRVGMFLLAATVLTIRNYYSVAPVEQVMAAGGLILIVGVYFIIKFLKIPRNGITDIEQADDKSADLLQLESLVIAETFHKTALPDNEGFKFGGGSSGGGGASGEY